MPSSIFRDDLLAGKLALITGGGTGIGAAIAREYSRLGATVVIASRKLDKLQRAAEGLSEQTGRPVHAIALDIRDRDRVAEVVAQVLEEHGPIDILVNNGGGQFMAPAETISPRGFDAVVATNLTGTWNLTQAVAKACMLKRGGRVVNITMLSLRGFPGMAHSVAARSGVESLTRTLAVEWASRGVRINAIAPGVVASSGLLRYPPELKVLDRARSIIPTKRLATRDEIAWMATYLASPAGEYITGQVMTIDGGASLWGDLWAVPDPKEWPEVEVEVDPWEQDSSKG